MALALQCCIGGSNNGFRVMQLRFRFSLASNRVGHFIYWLRDRVWPDFVCHFHLFRGKPHLLDESVVAWHADCVLPEISARKPMASRPNLKFLCESAALDHSCCSKLAKFGFQPRIRQPPLPSLSTPVC